jgi:hypothetical protein
MYVYNNLRTMGGPFRSGAGKYGNQSPPQDMWPTAQEGGAGDINYLVIRTFRYPKSPTYLLTLAALQRRIEDVRV